MRLDPHFLDFRACLSLPTWLSSRRGSSHPEPWVNALRLQAQPWDPSWHVDQPPPDGGRGKEATGSRGQRVQARGETRESPWKSLAGWDPGADLQDKHTRGNMSVLPPPAGAPLNHAQDPSSSQNLPRAPCLPAGQHSYRKHAMVRNLVRFQWSFANGPDTGPPKQRPRASFLRGVSKPTSATDAGETHFHRDTHFGLCLLLLGDDHQPLRAGTTP